MDASIKNDKFSNGGTNVNVGKGRVQDCDAIPDLEDVTVGVYNDLILTRLDKLLYIWMLQEAALLRGSEDEYEVPFNNHLNVS